MDRRRLMITADVARLVLMLVAALAALVAWAGLEALPFALNAGSFVVSALLLSGIHVPRHTVAADDEGESFWRVARSWVQHFGDPDGFAPSSSGAARIVLGR